MARTATFLRLRIVTGRKGANCGPESQQISYGAVTFRFADGGKESAIAKKLQESRDFCFHNEELCGRATKSGLSGWSARNLTFKYQKTDENHQLNDISFHVKQDAASESGFSERLARCSEISSARAVAFRRPR